MVTLVVVVVYKLLQCSIQFFWKVIVIQLDHVFQASMIAFNLTLGLRVVQFSMYLFYTNAFQVVFQFGGNIAGPIVREQLWFLVWCQVCLGHGLTTVRCTSSARMVLQSSQ